MKKLLLLSFFAVASTTQAQEYRDRIGFTLESIADINIGWMKIYNHPNPPTGKTLGNRVYNAKQIGNSQQFVEWMQQSYLPKGCLGSAGYYQNAIPKFSGTNSLVGNAINEHLAALPLMYGSFSRMYMYLKKDEEGKFVPQNNFSAFWRIEANQLQHISKPVSFISSVNEYYFVMPDFGSNSKGYNSDDKAASNLLGFDKYFKAYKHFYVPPKIIDDDQQYVVIMTQNNNELPFERITIGEFFIEAEKQLPTWQKVSPVSAENFVLAQKNLTRLKEKYKPRWNDIAEIKLSDNQFMLQDLVNAKEGNTDIFDNKDMYGKEGTTAIFPILKVKKSALDLCKTNQPQWLVIRWTMGMPNASFNKHLHESIMRNFNFDFVYNYFFGGSNEGYKPLRLPEGK
jgi:hypothetical protein